MAVREPYNNNMNQTTTHSPWHSPVPYLFGGLAAMLGLIAFALLILACSYWKLSGYLENSGDNQNGERDLEAGDGKPEDDEKKMKSPVMQEKFLVIMAGDVKPTYLATLSSASTSRSTSFESNKSCTCRDDDDEDEEEEKEDDDKEKGEKKEEEEGNDQVRRQSTGS